MLIRRHKSEHPLGFTLIEVLLAMSLASILLVSVTGFFFNISQLYFSEQNKPSHEIHARNATRFLDQVLQNANQETIASSNTQNQASIKWARIPGDSAGDLDHLSFKYSKEIPVIYSEDGPVPSATVWLHHDEGEGLFFIWQSKREERENPRDYFRSLISPHVKEIHYEYYDQRRDEWEDDVDDTKNNRPVPDMIRLVFQWSDDLKYETTILLPATLNGAPLY